MSVQKCFVTECIRRPEFDLGSVFTDTRNLSQETERNFYVFETVRREHVVDRVIVKGKTVFRQIQHVINAGRSDAIQTDEAFAFGAATPNVYFDRRF
jgi:hypothetical protein